MLQRQRFSINMERLNVNIAINQPIRAESGTVVEQDM